jgi:hypothetical protein
MIAYEHDEETDQYVSDYIRKINDLKHLFDEEVGITTCFCVRTDKDGQPVAGKTEPVKLRKISPAHKCFIDADFLVIIEKYDWDNSDARRNEAMLHSVLTNIVLEKKDSDSGERTVRTKIKKHDHRFNTSTLKLYGAEICDCLDLPGALTRTVVKDTKPAPVNQPPPKERTRTAAENAEDDNHESYQSDSDNDEVPRVRAAILSATKS